MLLEPILRAIAPLPILLLGLACAACDKQKASAPQPAAPTGDAGPPQEMGKVDVSHRGEAAPATPFLGPDGGPATLPRFRGRPLLVNLWATWCAPCVREMPTLDRLAKDRAADFQLVAISQDIAGRRDVLPYFAKAGLVSLQPYLDKQNVLMEALKLDTLPVTIFYDRRGREQWRVVGSMDWAGPRAKKLLDDALNPPGA